MPAFSRAVFLGLQAAALVSLVGSPFAPSTALAAPLPLPMPLMPHLADYAARPPAQTTATAAPPSESTSVAKQEDAAVVSHTASNSSPVVARDDANLNTAFLNNINILNNMYGAMDGHAQTIQQLAGRASTEGDNEDFRQQVVSEFSAYQDGLLGFQSLLAQLGADKGLANYDKTNQLETVLRDTTNMTKNILKYVDQLVYQIPVFGPVLAPIVYEIKCIVDDILNAVENLTDAILNALQPLLLELVGQATQTACGFGLQIGGLCLLL